MTDEKREQTEPVEQQPVSQTLSKEGRWLLLAQLVPAIVGIFIGCLALYAALSEADAVRKQQQAAVWPYAEITDNRTINSNDLSYNLLISNKGIGPARVKSFTVLVDGETYSSWEQVINAVSSQDLRPIAYSQGTIAGKVLAPGEAIRIMQISSTGADPSQPDADNAVQNEAHKFYEQLTEDFAVGRETGRVQIKYCYCSVFEECWKVEERRQEPVRIDACPTPELASSL